MTNKKPRHSGMDAGQIRQEWICIYPIGVQGRIALHESRHKDVNVQFGTVPESSAGVTGKLPSMALDARVPAGMTTLELFRKNDRLKYIRYWPIP
jgi:hypothetical protein